MTIDNTFSQGCQQGEGWKRNEPAFSPDLSARWPNHSLRPWF